MTLTENSTFVPGAILNALDRLSEDQADRMNFGIVKVDDQGNIELYNKYNYDHFADFKGLRVIGRNYFTEVAPCANNFIFSGRFKRGVASGTLNTQFDYCFTYKLIPTNVKVHLYRDAKSGSNWIFVKKA